MHHIFIEEMRSVHVCSLKKLTDNISICSCVKGYLPCVSCLCVYITEVWALHEMDGPGTCSDIQPRSFNIPLALVLFFMGSKGASCCGIIHCVLLELMQTHSHVGPPVVQQAFSIKSSTGQDFLEPLFHCRHLHMQDYLV